MSLYLRYASNAIRDDEISFLSDEEKRDLFANGHEAASRFSQESLSLWLEYQAQKKEQIGKQIEHSHKWRVDIAKAIEDMEAASAEDDLSNVRPAFRRRGIDVDMKLYFLGALPIKRKRLRNKADWVAQQTFHAQCYLLARMPVVPHNLEAQGRYDLSEYQYESQGVCLNDLYPVVSCQHHLLLLDSLAYDFGYGPNAFPWREKRMKRETLESVPTHLYLVSIDVGKLTGGSSLLVWKIGITTKHSVIGERDSESRFSGRLGSHVKVLRQKMYQCGLHAYIKEQVYLEQVQGEKTRSLDKKYSFEKLTESELGRLGVSEWVLEGRQESLAISYFDRITMMD